MSDVNVFKEERRNKPGLHRIESMKIADLTSGAESVSVVMTSTRTINQVDDQAEGTRLKNAAKASPWTNSALSQSFANKSLRTRKLKDPVEELKLFTDSITRG